MPKRNTIILSIAAIILGIIIIIIYSGGSLNLKEIESIFMLTIGKSSLKNCQFNDDCVWATVGGSCSGCWNKKALKYESPAMCIQDNYCVCEKNICQNPSKEWILQNKEFAIEKCRTPPLFRNEQMKKICQDIMDD